MRLFIASLLALSLLSCKKKNTTSTDDSPAPTTTTPTPTTAPVGSDVTVNVTNMAGSSVLFISKDTVYKASTPKYISAYGDTFSVTKLKYYISNIKFHKPDGSFFAEKESYHLLNAADSAKTCKFIVKDVPFETYTYMSFVIGVDSTRNVSGAQTGDLEPGKDMFWSWSQGYIFFKFEAYTPSVPNFGGHNIEYHVGGFKGNANNIKNVTLNFPSNNLVVDKAGGSKIFMKANVLECLKTPTVLSFAALPTAINASSAKPVANNYVDMFSVSAITR